MVKSETVFGLPRANINDGNAPKRSRGYLNRPDDDVQVPPLGDVLTRMENLFRETNNKIDAFMRDLRTEISTLRSEIQQLKEKYEEKTNHLTASIETVRADVSYNAERVACSGKANDLLVSGVPYTLGENLAGIANAISVALGYTEDIPLVHVKRLARFPIQPNAVPPIRIQFAFKCVRDEFYHRYLSSRNLSLAHLGFDVNQRIFINENLTKEGRGIKYHAVKLKKNGKLFGVFTRDGCVFVKTAVDAEAILVRSINELPK